ncbi:MAG: dTDP-3-amino-3,4,6-trideoxy-alpha-D-glucopyranose N,N-dimethyltransferase [Acidimicrobiaceae bacterium]|jgi:dTDP-3-amino-3,4,6-trideoxy-alpha-D-glucopyranose N,N-dimethyltransferase/N-dimethyltransferase
MYAGAAQFYDVIHDARGREANAEADIVIAEVRRHCPQAATLLDVACGTGAHLPRFAEFFDVAGVDLSADMLALAAARCPEVPLVAADMRSFDLQRQFDAVVCLFSGIGYLTDEAGLVSAVAAMAAHVAPGGVLLIEGWIEPDEWLGSSVHAECGKIDGLAVTRVARSYREGRLTQIFMRYTAATVEDITTVDEHHTMRLSDPIEFERAFRSAGLTCERLPHLLHPGRSVFVGLAPE